MAVRGGIAESLVRAIDGADRRETPFRHWLLADILPPGVGAAFCALPIAPPAIPDTKGKRDTNNVTRSYANAWNRARLSVCDDLARALQDGPAVDAIQRVFGIGLVGTNLRIEYCQDTDGFWLEPHTDIGAKKFTFLIYLDGGPNGSWLGTDLMDEKGNVLGSAPFAPNRGLVFIPGGDTWHGFRRRPFAGVRRSLIVNYVGPEWRARHELAFPDRPVGAPA